MTEHNDYLPSPDEDDNHASEAITFDRVLEILHKGEFSEVHGAIQWSSNYTFLTSINHEDVTVMAVYKPRRGERPLWDFPDGTLCNRERAAFLVSEALGWKLAPPTVLREGPRGFGSVQFYVDHDPENHYFTFDDTLRPQLMRLAAFDVLINNADRKGGHCLLDAQGHLWAIDHGITFHAGPKLRTVVWNFADQAIPDVLLEDVEKLCDTLEAPDDPFALELRDLLSAREMQSFARRVDRMLTDRRYPTPGPGPNYPWPPV